MFDRAAFCDIDKGDVSSDIIWKIDVVMDVWCVLDIWVSHLG